LTKKLAKATLSFISLTLATENRRNDYGDDQDIYHSVIGPFSFNRE
jgi:hypothetical protein